MQGLAVCRLAIRATAMPAAWGIVGGEIEVLVLEEIEVLVTRLLRPDHDLQDVAVLGSAC